MTVREHKEVLVKYIMSRIELQDWHAVRDVAVDIEVLEAKNPEIRNAKVS